MSRHRMSAVRQKASLLLLVPFAAYSLVSCASQTGADLPSSIQGAGPAQIRSIQDLPPLQLETGEKLRLVATTSLIGDILKNVGGDTIELQTLFPLGADPHAFEPTPQDLRTITEAHALFINGLGLERFMDEILSNAGETPIILSISEGIQPRALGENYQLREGVDPHVWMDPANVITWVENAAEALSALNPAQVEGYASRARRYRHVLEELDSWTRDQIAQVPESDRILVTDHDELSYFAARYGLEIIGTVIPAFSTVAEPSAQELADLEDTMRALGVKVVFVGRDLDPAVARQVASDTGVQLVPLFIGSLSEPGGPAESYEELMKYNVKAIVKALQ